MSIEKPTDLHHGPPLAVMDALRKRLAVKELKALEASFMLRAVSRQVDGAFAECMADSVGSVARFQILMALLATKSMTHKDIGVAMGVTRATVSGLMTGLERDGLVESAEDIADRRKQIARLTLRGEEIVNKAFEANLSQLRFLFAALSATELTRLMDLLRRIRESAA